MKTIQIRRTRHAGHCWRSRDELISDVLLWTPSHRRTKARRPAGINIQHLCADTGCSLENLLGAMDDREKWREKVMDINAGCVTWLWWWWLDQKFSFVLVKYLFLISPINLYTYNFYYFPDFSLFNLISLQFQLYTPKSMSRHWCPGLITKLYMSSK